MAEKKYIEFLNKLIDDTKERKIEWKYLDKNKILYEGMNWTKVSSVLGLFLEKKKKLTLILMLRTVSIQLSTKHIL